MRRFSIIISIFFISNCYSQHISVFDLIEIAHKNGFDSASNIIYPEELYYLDSSAALNISCLEFEKSYIQKDLKSKNPNRVLYGYPIHTIELSQFANNDNLGLLLLKYYQSIDLYNHYSTNDTLYTIFGHGWFDNLLLSLIQYNPNQLAEILSSDLESIVDSISNVRTQFPYPIVRFFMYFKGTPEIIGLYQDLNYRGLQISLAINTLQKDKIGSEQISQFRKGLPRWRRDYEFPTKRDTSYCDSNYFQKKEIRLSKQYNDIITLIQNEKIFIKEIFGSEFPEPDEYCNFQKPYIYSENKVLFWHRCNFNGWGNGALYLVTMINNNTIILEEIKVYL